MDTKKIGEFIAQQRKEKELTQKQLGETLGISDKTVSKWECGKGLPDISMIMPLCDFLGINVNELLSGERLTQDTYPEKAEENIINLIQSNEDESRKRGLLTKILSGIIWLLIIIAFLAFLPAVLPNTLDSYVQSILGCFDPAGILEVICITLLSLCFAGRLKDFRNAFIFLLHEAEEPRKLNDAVMAVALAEKSLLYGGAFCTVFYAIWTLFNYDSSTGVSVLAANMGVSLLTLFYGLFGIIILAPVKGRLLKQAAYQEPEDAQQRMQAAYHESKGTQQRMLAAYQEPEDTQQQR